MPRKRQLAEPAKEKLQTAAAAAIDTPAVSMRLRQIGADPAAAARRSPAYLQAFVASEIAKWAGPIKAAGLSQD